VPGSVCGKLRGKFCLIDPACRTAAEFAPEHRASGRSVMSAADGAVAGTADALNPDQKSCLD
jgi:hypothetical protein